MEHRYTNRYFVAIMIILFISAVSSVFSCGSPKNENIKVRSYASSEKSIESFKILKKYNPELSYDATGAIDQTSRKIIVFIKQAEKVDLASLRPSFTIKGSYISRDNEVQQTGMETVDFNKPLDTPVEYTVYADDGSSLTYSVFVQFGLLKPSKPGAISLGIKNYPYKGQTLEASYSYFDSNGDLEGKTEVTWLYEKNYGSDQFEVLHSATRTGPDDVGYLKYTLDNDVVVGHRIKLVVTPKSDEAKTSRLKDGVDQNEENGDPISILSNTIVKNSPEDCVVINEFRASTKDETAQNDDGTTTITVKGTTNEFIELYNPTDKDINLTGYSIEVGDSVYVNFSHTIFVLPSPTPGPNVVIPPGHCFLVTNSLASNDVKKLADVVVDVEHNAFSEIPDSSGIIRLIRLKDSLRQVVDRVGYGSDAADYEGARYAPSAVIDKSIGRTDGVDMDQNSFDFVVKASFPMSSGINVIDETPPTVTDIKIQEYKMSAAEDPDSVDQSYEVTKKYNDVNYDNEGVSLYRWRPFYCHIDDHGFSNKVYLDGLKEDGSKDPDAKIVFSGPFDGSIIAITPQDFDKIPDECILYLEVRITPVSITGDNPDTAVDETIGSTVIYNTTASPGLCVSKVNNAKLLITQIFPYRNIVNLYALRSGSLDNLSLALSKYSAELDDQEGKYDFTEGASTNFRVFLGKGGSTITAGQYVAVLLKSNASRDPGDPDGANWDGKCSIKADNTNTDPDTNVNASFFSTNEKNDDGYINSIGGAVSVSELTDVVEEDGQKYPQYTNKDMFVFAAGDHPCELSDAFKRMILQSNFATVTANSGNNADSGSQDIIFNQSDYAWYVSNQTFPKKSDYTTNIGLPNEQFDLDSYNKYYITMSSDRVIASVNAETDYFKIPITLSNYIVYRPPYIGKVEQTGDWYYDYYMNAFSTTPHFISDFSAIDYVSGIEYVYNKAYQPYIPSATNLSLAYDSTKETLSGSGGNIDLYTTKQYLVMSSPGVLSLKAECGSTDIALFSFTVDREYNTDSYANRYKVQNPIKGFGYTFCSYKDFYVDQKDNLRIERRQNGSKFIDTNTASDFTIMHDATGTSYTLVKDDIR